MAIQFESNEWPYKNQMMKPSIVTWKLQLEFAGTDRSWDYVMRFTVVAVAAAAAVVVTTLSQSADIELYWLQMCATLREQKF